MDVNLSEGSVLLASWRSLPRTMPEWVQYIQAEVEHLKEFITTHLPATLGEVVPLHQEYTNCKGAALKDYEKVEFVHKPGLQCTISLETKTLLGLINHPDVKVGDSGKVKFWGLTCDLQWLLLEVAFRKHREEAKSGWLEIPTAVKVRLVPLPVLLRYFTKYAGPNPERLWEEIEEAFLHWNESLQSLAETMESRRIALKQEAQLAHQLKSGRASK